MSHVSKEMAYAVRMARWAEWERLAKELPGGHHILSVEILRTHRNETAIVLTVVRNHKLVQYELRGDANGKNAKPVVSRHRTPDHGYDPKAPQASPLRLDALVAIDAGDSDDGPIGESIPLGEPPPKEDPQPGATALGETLLHTAFGIGENAVSSDDTSSR